MKKKFLMGFSLIEVLIALIIVSVLMAASVPILTKKAQNITVLGGSQSEEIKAECSIFGSDCSLCYSSKCIVCNKTCLETQFKDIENCNCKNCSNEDLGGAGCKKCNKTTCLECDSSKFLNSSNKCTSCPQNATCNGKEMTCKSGYYRKDDTCIKCTDSFGSACTACNKDGCTSCSSGSYATGGSCVSCSTFDTNCTSCSASGCTKCKSGYNVEEAKCAVACPTGTYQSGNNCFYCGTGCESCDSSGCKTCQDGYYYSWGKCELCSSKFGSACERCDSGGCYGCAKGYYRDYSTNNCISCDTYSHTYAKCYECNSMGCTLCNNTRQPVGECISCQDLGGPQCSVCNTRIRKCTQCRTGYKLVNDYCVAE